MAIDQSWPAIPGVYCGQSRRALPARLTDISLEELDLFAQVGRQDRYWWVRQLLRSPQGAARISFRSGKGTARAKLHDLAARLDYAGRDAPAIAGAPLPETAGVTCGKIETTSNLYRGQKPYRLDYKLKIAHHLVRVLIESS
jgi:hypothetical protein